MTMLSEPRATSPAPRAPHAAIGGSVDNAPFWTQYLNALVGVVPGANLPGLQLAPEATAIDLGDPDQSLVNQAIHQFSDPLPGWSMMYAPTETSLFSQYGLFLNGLQLTQKDTSPQLAAQLKADEAQLRSDVAQLMADLNSGMPSTIISADQQQVDGDIQTVSADLEAINGPNYTVLGQDLSNYSFAQNGILPSSVGNQLTMPTPSQIGPAIQVPLYQIGGGFLQWLATAESNAAAGINQETLNFNQSDSTTYSGAFTSSTSQSESIFFGWYDETSGSWQQVQTSGGQQLTYTVNVYLPGVILLGVQPGGWFDGTLIADFANGPFQSGSPFSNSTIYGADGIFNLLPQQLLVVYQPTIEVVFDQSSWNTFQSAYTNSSCSALSVGPFRANSSASSNQYSATASFDSTNFTMTFTDNSGLPHLLAVVADVLP
jgi:hypothetical protein